MTAPAPGPSTGAGSPALGAGAVGLRLSLYYAALFGVIGVLLPFWPVWLASRGLGAAEIGTVLSAALWVQVAAGIATARLADAWGERRRLLIALAVGALASYLLFLQAHGFLAILAISVLARAFFAGLIPLGDNLTLMNAARHGLDYGRIRLWGSLGFIAASAAGGWVLAGRRADVVLWMALALLAATLAAALLLPAARGERSAGARDGVRRLAAHPVFLLFLASGSLIQASHAVLYGFGTLHWRAAGHGDDVIGWLWAEGVIAEVILFAAGNRLVERLGPARLLVLAGLGGVARWTLAAMTAALPVLAVVQAMHALTFAAAHLGAMHFLTRAAPEGLSATAQGLYASLAMGAASGLTMLLAGFLYGRFGGTAFLAMAAMALAGTLGALALWRLWTGERLEAPSAAE